jgi:hypothetical protein
MGGSETEGEVAKEIFKNNQFQPWESAMDCADKSPHSMALPHFPRADSTVIVPG